MLKMFRKSPKAAEDELRELLDGYDVPSFPEAVMNVLSLLRDPKAPTSAIAKEMEMDPGLHVKVLKLVNSAAFRLSSEVSNVGHAASLLGRSRLEVLVVSVAVNATMSSIDIDGFDINQFWRTAAKRGSLARTLAGHLHPSTQAEAFTSGLLQDVAVPIIAERKGAAYVDIYERWKSVGETKRLDEMEREAFSYDHTGIGAMVARAWNLPEFIVDDIEGHHKPDDEAAVEPAIKLVSLIRDYEDAELDTMFEMCEHNHGVSREDFGASVDEAIEDALAFHKMITGGS